MIYADIDFQASLSPEIANHMRNIFISLVFGFFALPILAQSGCVTNCVITNPSNSQIITQPSGTAFGISGNLTANGASTQLIPYIMVTFYGASGDATSIFNLSTTAGSNTITNAISVFTSKDVGKAIEIYGVGTSGSGN